MGVKSSVNVSGDVSEGGNVAMSKADISSGVTGGTAATGDLAAEVVEISGAIKWFDVSKGFGFIIPDEDMPDVLVHVTVLRKDGFSTVLEGSRIVCEATKGEKGWQALRVLSMDVSTAVQPDPDAEPRTCLLY